MQGPIAVELCQLALDRGDALAHEPAVDFQLAFAFTETAAHAAAHSVAGQVGPHAAQAWKQVLVLGQAHLQAAFARVGVQGEDVEDEGRPVYDLHVAVDAFLQVRLLRGRKLVVEYHDVGPERPAQVGKLLGLARTDEGGRVGRGELLGDTCDGLGARRIGKAP